MSLLKKSLDAYKTDGHTDRVLCIENHPGRSKFDCSSVRKSRSHAIHDSITLNFLLCESLKCLNYRNRFLLCRITPTSSSRLGTTTRCSSGTRAAQTPSAPCPASWSAATESGSTAGAGNSSSRRGGRTISFRSDLDKENIDERLAARFTHPFVTQFNLIDFSTSLSDRGLLHGNGEVAV